MLSQLRVNRMMRAVAVSAVVFCLSTLVFGQANGSISGTVADNTGAVLSGANVTITSQATNSSRNAKTDD